MGWTCQHDFSGFCKRVQQPCVPGMKGCTLKGNFIFSGELHKDEKEEKKEDDKQRDQEIDFAQLARSN